MAVKCGDLTLQRVGPEDALVLRLRARELHHHFARLKVCHNCALVASGRQDKIMIGHAPCDRFDSTVVNVLEGRHRVVSLAQVPDVHAWILVVVVGHNELSGQLRVPHHTRLLSSRLAARRISKVLSWC